MTGSILKFHYSKSLTYILLGITVPWVVGVTILLWSSPETIRFAGGRKFSAVGNAVEGGTLLGSVMTYMILLLMAWFSIFLIRQAIGFLIRLKGGDVPAVSFGVDTMEVNTAFGSYELSRSDIKKMKIRSAFWSKFLFIYLNKPYRYRKITGFKLKKIDLFLPLQGLSKKQLADAIAKWQVLKMPEPTEASKPAPVYGVEKPVQQGKSPWKAKSFEPAEGAVKSDPIDSVEGSVVKPHRPARKIFGRRQARI